MNYEQKYKEALEKAQKELQSCGSKDCDAARQIYRFFPELKESEDEMIRQDIIDWLINYKDNVQVDLKDEEVDRWVSCLEKQGEQENLCDKCRKEQPSHSCQDITALGRCALEKQGEQKPVKCIKFDNEFENQISHLIASVLNGEHEYNEGFVKYASQSLLGFAKKEQKSADKVKHEFKVGDWITTVNDEGGIAIEKVVEFLGNKVRLIDTDGVYMLCPQSWLNHYHLWTIQDAKDGDVLMANAPFIFNGNLEGGIGCPGAHCGINTLGEFQIPKYQEHWTGHTTTPATKEQRNLLFSKMEEAGYEWDAEKKELKKIEQTSTWSEEDEGMYLRTLGILGTCRLGILPTKVEEELRWFKSIEPQSHWKPSKDQMFALSMHIQENPNLESLYSDLQKLL